MEVLAACNWWNTYMDFIPSVSNIVTSSSANASAMFNWFKPAMDWIIGVELGVGVITLIIIATIGVINRVTHAGR